MLEDGHCCHCPRKYKIGEGVWICRHSAKKAKNSVYTSQYWESSPCLFLVCLQEVQHPPMELSPCFLAQNGAPLQGLTCCVPCIMHLAHLLAHFKSEDNWKDLSHIRAGTQCLHNFQGAHFLNPDANSMHIVVHCLKSLTQPDMVIGASLKSVASMTIGWNMLLTRQLHLTKIMSHPPPTKSQTDALMVTTISKCLHSAKIASHDHRSSLKLTHCSAPTSRGFLPLYAMAVEWPKLSATACLILTSRYFVTSIVNWSILARNERLTAIGLRSYDRSQQQIIHADWDTWQPKQPENLHQPWCNRSACNQLHGVTTLLDLTVMFGHINNEKQLQSAICNSAGCWKQCP